jgi:hypothetical protein
MCLAMCDQTINASSLAELSLIGSGALRALFKGRDGAMYEKYCYVTAHKSYFIVFRFDY